MKCRIILDVNFFIYIINIYNRNVDIFKNILWKFFSDLKKWESEKFTLTIVFRNICVGYCNLHFSSIPENYYHVIESVKHSVETFFTETHIILVL